MSKRFQVEHLFLYPIKSCQPLGISSSQPGVSRIQFVDDVLLGDRQWMLVDSHHKFVTQRQLPKLAEVAVLHSLGDQFSAPELVCRLSGQPDLLLRVPHASDASTPSLSVRVWEDTVQAHRDSQGSAWFSNAFQTDLHLVCLPLVGSRHRQKPDKLLKMHFSDGYPIHLHSLETLLWMEKKLGIALEPQRFRANVVVSGCEAFGEFRLGNLQANGVIYQLCKETTRCLMTNQPQMGGTPQSEVLREIIRLGKAEKKANLGVYFAPQGTGSLQVGETLTTI